MKPLILIWTMIIIAALIAMVMIKSDSVNKTLPTSLQPTVTFPPTVSQIHRSLFVPYWSLSGNDIFPDKYSTLLYFGITANVDGVETQEQGHVSISQFTRQVKGKQQTLLVLRLLDNDENTKILDSSISQQKIISQTISIAKQHNFSGIVTDLELRALPFRSLVDEINSFNDKFSQQTKQAGLLYGLTMYGDVFYRVRPFDMAHLANDADMVYVLAYDLHKPNGQPGPNFPIKAADNGDYDLSSMVQDYQNVLSSSKITIVFGMFGYDWQVNAKGASIGNATAVTDDTLQQKFLSHSCGFTRCSHTWDPTSGELTIQYTDTHGLRHIIWSDDLQSTSTKEKFLQQYGVSNFSYWTYGYF